MSLIYYLHQYVKTNHFTFFLFIFLMILPFFKTIPWPVASARKRLCFIILLGLILRMAWLGFSSYTPQTAWTHGHMLESDITNIHALEMTKGIWFHGMNGEPIARRPIGYPLALGLIYKIFGPHVWAAYLFNVSLYVLTAIFIFLIGRTLFNSRLGLLAVFLFAVYPISIYSVKMMTDEHLFLPLWFGGLYLLFLEIKGRSVPWALLWYGLIFGYATMVRTNTIFMPFVVALAYFLLKFNWKKIIISFATVLVLMQALNLPWIARNYKIWGVPMLYTASVCYVYSRVNSSATPEGAGRIPLRGEPGFSEELERASGNPALYDAICKRLMQKWMIEHPKEFVSLGTKRLLNFMCWNRAGVWPIWFQYYTGSFDPARPLSQGLRDFFEEISYAYYYILFFVFLFAVFLLIKRWKKLEGSARNCLWILWSCFFFWFLQHMIIYPDRKYRFPLEVLMMLVACYFLEHWMFNARWKIPGKKLTLGRR
ncbi:MAG: glycosyltransferase family 39 protein [Patescibacteria group bacterium]